jgi:hypothetical protein
LKANFGSNPFALRVGRLGRVVAASATAESGAEVGALDLIELFDLAPGFVADGAGYVDFQSYDRHKMGSPHL